MTRQLPIAGVSIGRAAIRALHAEVMLHPKPGLVSPVDNGAHRDMDIGTFMRSLFALRGYFVAISTATDFPQMQRLGIEAEARMMAATGGVNTHRGAIFSLGLLAAAAGRMTSPTPDAVCMAVAHNWGDALRAMPARASNGTAAIRRHGATGARINAAEGFPHLRHVVLPAMKAGPVQALFASMAVLEDTNLLHRGGAAGLAHVQSGARAFLAAGGVHAHDWRARAEALHRSCVARNLSPGGSADMLACAMFLRSIC